jgi:hypothetical protein
MSKQPASYMLESSDDVMSDTLSVSLHTCCVPLTTLAMEEDATFNTTAHDFDADASLAEGTTDDEAEEVSLTGSTSMQRDRVTSTTQVTLLQLAHKLRRESMMEDHWNLA